MCSDDQTDTTVLLGKFASDEIFEGGTCSLKGQRSRNEHLIKYISKKAFLIFFNFWLLNL